MGVNKPYYRTCRQFKDGRYAEGGRWMYIIHPKYAESPEHYIRAFLLLQNDLFKLFEYIEPAQKNKNTFSFRIHELLLRVCVEVEANCKAILKENGYCRSGDWNMEDYKKIERSHRLSEYNVKLPIWNGKGDVRRPFAKWASGKSLPWYSIYNHTKHDRHTLFQEATIDSLIDAISGLVVILSAQFWTEDFSPASRGLAISGKSDGMESAIGSYFRVKFPDSLPKEERYNFKWQSLENDPCPFQPYPY